MQEIYIIIEIYKYDFEAIQTTYGSTSLMLYQIGRAQPEIYPLRPLREDRLRSRHKIGFYPPTYTPGRFGPGADASKSISYLCLQAAIFRLSHMGPKIETENAERARPSGCNHGDREALHIPRLHTQGAIATAQEVV